MKKYIISSYIPNADIDVDFYNSLVSMGEHVDAELIIANCKENYKGDLESLLQYSLDEELADVVQKGSLKLNNNLTLTDYRPSINVIDPLSGLAVDSAATAFGNMIVAFPRHRFKSIARSLKQSNMPRGVWCTGTVSEPYYKPTKSGQAMKGYHVKGALIVEVKDDKFFSIRQLQFDGKGFYDLDTYYTPKGHKKVKGAIVGLTLGDIHPPFINPEVMDHTLDFIKKHKPGNVIMHDVFDASSISHHVIGKHITKSIIKRTIGSLRDELSMTAYVMQRLADSSKGSNFHVVKSNHDDHLDRYLDEFRFKEDYLNLELAVELTAKYITYGRRGAGHILEYALKKFRRLNNVKFYGRGDSLLLAGYEVLNHGDHGANGARGTPKSFGAAFGGKSVTGHGHTPEITAFGNSVCGTMTYLSVPYTNDSGLSGWMNTHTIIYSNGTISQYHII